jgi:hypothetical protein
VLFFGTGLPEDRWHDRHESVHVDVPLAGAATMCLFSSPCPRSVGCPPLRSPR